MRDQNIGDKVPDRIGGVQPGAVVAWNAGRREHSWVARVTGRNGVGEGDARGNAGSGLAHGGVGGDAGGGRGRNTVGLLPDRRTLIGGG